MLLRPCKTPFKCDCECRFCKVFKTHCKQHKRGCHKGNECMQTQNNAN